MDPVELLRSHYDDQREPDAARMDAVRQRLQVRFDTETTASRRPALTRRRVLVLAGAGAAAVAGVTVLLTGLPGGQSAAATELLQRAARRAARSSLTTPGTVVQIRQRSFETTGAGNGLGAPVVVATRETVTLLKVPASGEPWERKRWETRYDYAYGDRSKLPANMAVTDPTGTKEAAFERSKSGHFTFGATDVKDRMIAESFDAIGDLPHDPDELLRDLKADGQGPGRGSAHQVLDSAAYILGRGVAGSELQALMFEVLQRIPELAILDEHAVDLEGRTGVGLGVKPGVPDPTDSGEIVQLIIDPATGQYLGSRSVSTRRNGLIPKGVQVWADTVRTDVTTTAADWTPVGNEQWAVYP